MGFGLFDTVFSIMFPLIFVLVFGIILYAIISNIREWNHNNHQPLLTVEATVAAKRTRYHQGSDNSMGTTSYYATFQVESGDRMEFHVTGREYGMLAEGDCGRLSFQGSRYQGFERR